MKTIFILFLTLFTLHANAQETPTLRVAPAVYDFPEVEAEFIGGKDSLISYVTNNIVYPQIQQHEDLDTKVYVSFVIEKDGTVTNVKVERGSHELLNKEAIRLVRSMPNWIPATDSGQAVRSRQLLPIQIELK